MYDMPFATPAAGSRIGANSGCTAPAIAAPVAARPDHLDSSLANPSPSWSPAWVNPSPAWVKPDLLVFCSRHAVPTAHMASCDERPFARCFGSSDLTNSRYVDCPLPFMEQWPLPEVVAARLRGRLATVTSLSTCCFLRRGLRSLNSPAGIVEAWSTARWSSCFRYSAANSRSSMQSRNRITCFLFMRLMVLPPEQSRSLARASFLKSCTVTRGAMFAVSSLLPCMIVKYG